MYCNDILKTVRGDLFLINIYNDGRYDTSQGNKIKMTLRKTLNGEVLCTDSTTFKENGLTKLSFSPKEMEDKEGFYYIDIEVSNTTRTFVTTPLVTELKVVKDVTHG